MKLDEPDHRSLAVWAADCAGRVLPYFEEERPEDDRPRRAVEPGMAWARGEIRVGEARAGAIAAHAAATANMAARAPHAADYVARAVASDVGLDEHAVAEERDLQHRCLPEHLRTVMFPIG